MINEKKMNTIAQPFDRFPMTQLPVASHFGFHSDFYEKTAPFTELFQPIIPLIEEYRAALDVEKRIYTRPTSMRNTPFLRQADHRRDRLLGVIQMGIRAHLANPIEERRNAALQLRAQLSGYRGMAKHKYGASTAEYMGFIRTLREEENAAFIARLGLTEEVEALADAEQKFEEIYFGKATDEALERAELRAIDTQETRRRVDKAYRALTLYLGAMAIAFPSPDLQAVVGWHNGAAWKLRRAIANQGKTWKRKPQEKPETETPNDNNK